MPKTITVIAILASGCAGLEEHAYMPTELDEMTRNPALMNCGDEQRPVCRVRGGRYHKTYEMCRCQPVR